MKNTPSFECIVDEKNRKKRDETKPEGIRLASSPDPSEKGTGVRKLFEEQEGWWRMNR